MPRNYMHSQIGFTLIEFILYIALFAIIIGGCLVGVYNIVEGSSRNQAQITLYEEGNFLAKKFENAINGAQSITSPGAGSTGTTLTVSKNGADQTFSLASDQIQFTEGSGGTPMPLDSDAVTVSGLVISHLTGNGVKINYTLSYFNVSREFELIKYINQ